MCRYVNNKIMWMCVSIILPSSPSLTTVLKKGCFRASSAVIRFSTSTTRHFRIRSLGSSASHPKTLIYCPLDTLILYSPDISAHSGDVKLYFPSMIFLSITICLRCQNGGQPTSSVNIITPQAHLEIRQKSFESIRKPNNL